MKLKCNICGSEFKSLLSHVKFKHDMDPSKYREIYGVEKMAVYSDEQRLNMASSQKKRFLSEIEREKNSNIQKNGASIFTKKYWLNRGLSEIEAKNKVSEIQKKNSIKHAEKIKPEHSIFNKEYWVIKKGYTDIDAVNKVSKIQSEMSSRSKKYFGKKSTVERNEKISKSLKKHILNVGVDKWTSHFGTFNGGVSKTEMEFFEQIKKSTNLDLIANFPIGNYIVDILYDKKIIEFNGDFWHANPLLYKGTDIVNIPNTNGILAESIWKKDYYRIDYLIRMGYDVMVVWESEWNTQREICIEKIKKYYEIDDTKCG